jgi:pullulanase
MMLTDRLKANKKLKAGELQRLSKLAQTAVLTSQGMPFLWCGEEIARDKKGVHNSYCSPDEINSIDWSLKAQNIDLFRYYQGLITLRKSHPAFHMGDAELVRENVHFLPVAEGVVAYQLNGEAVGDSWKTIIVVLNGQEKAAQVALPAGEFHYACVDGKCPADMATVVSGTLRVAPQSAAIVYCL